MTERYVTARELAALMGVSVRTVRAWTVLANNPIPSETWGLHARRYLPSECIRWARSRAHPDGGKIPLVTDEEEAA